MYGLTIFTFSFIQLAALGPRFIPTPQGIIDRTTNVLSTTIIGVTFLVATIVFFWGLVVFIAKADNPEERKKAKGLMIWGIIGMAVIAAAWGIVAVLVNFFQIGGTVIPQPAFPK